MDSEERCEGCGSLRDSNVYCWGCGEKLPPSQIGTKKQSVDSDNAKPQKDGLLLEQKRIPKRTMNKDGKFRKKRSDTGKPRRKKHGIKT